MACVVVVSQLGVQYESGLLMLGTLRCRRLWSMTSRCTWFGQPIGVGPGVICDRLPTVAAMALICAMAVSVLLVSLYVAAEADYAPPRAQCSGSVDVCIDLVVSCYFDGEEGAPESGPPLCVGLRDPTAKGTIVESSLGFPRYP